MENINEKQPNFNWSNFNFCIAHSGGKEVKHDKNRILKTLLSCFLFFPPECATQKFKFDQI